MMHWKSMLFGALIVGVPQALVLIWALQSYQPRLGQGSESEEKNPLVTLSAGQDSESDPDKVGGVVETEEKDDETKWVSRDEWLAWKDSSEKEARLAAVEAVADEVESRVQSLAKDWRGFLFSPHNDKFYSSLLELTDEQTEAFILARNSIQEARHAIINRTLAREGYSPDLFKELMEAVRAEELIEMGGILNSEQLEKYLDWTGSAGMEFYPGRTTQVDVNDLLNERAAELAQEILQDSQYDRLATDPAEISSNPAEYLRIPVNQSTTTYSTNSLAVPDPE